jgi:hypothetical protein
MKFKIELTQNFRPRGGFYTPGIYRVPEDLSEDLAEQAVNEGGAKRLEKLATFPAPKPKFAYSTKVLPAAPENKSEVDGADGDSGGDRPIPVKRGRGRPPKQDSAGGK